MPVARNPIIHSWSCSLSGLRKSVAVEAGRGISNRSICLVNGTLPLRSTSGEPIRTGCTSRHSTAGFVSITCQFHQCALGNVPDIGKWRVPLHADDVSQLVNKDLLHNFFQKSLCPFSSVQQMELTFRLCSDQNWFDGFVESIRNPGFGKNTPCKSSRLHHNRLGNQLTNTILIQP